MKQLLVKNSSFIGTILNKRVALATQLSVEPPYSSEDFQVANYGVGGQYGIHSDAFDFTDVFASSETDVIKHYERNTGKVFILSWYFFLIKLCGLNLCQLIEISHSVCFIRDYCLLLKSPVRLFIFGLLYPAVRLLGTIGYSGH